MHYEGNIIRPPAESRSILLQITVSCSHNACTFCGTYPGEKFRVKEAETVLADLREASRIFPKNKRVFLCDGDALILPFSRMKEVLEQISEHLPQVARINSYATPQSLRKRSIPELIELKKLGLHTLHLGVESGDDHTLLAVNKGATATEIEQTAKKAQEAGLQLSVTVILGLAGRKRSLIHARKTGEILSRIQPEQAAALTLMLVPGTALYQDEKTGCFELPDAQEMLIELGELIQHTNMRGQFFANHASNFLPLKGRLPKDKEKLLGLVKAALRGEVPLVSDFWREL